MTAGKSTPFELPCDFASCLTPTPPFVTITSTCFLGFGNDIAPLIYSVPTFFLFNRKSGFLSILS